MGLLKEIIMISPRPALVCPSDNSNGTALVAGPALLGGSWVFRRYQHVCPFRLLWQLLRVLNPTEPAPVLGFRV